MNGAILENLAKRVFKCPCCPEIFESQPKFRQHLCESHKSEICHNLRVCRREDFSDVEIPDKIYFCGHCLEANTPDPFVSDAFGKIDKHIRAEHSDPSLPSRLIFGVSKDSALIDRFAEEAGFQDVCTCSRCGEIFDDDASVALHWAEKYCETVTVEEMRGAFEAHPERFRISLAESLAEIAQEEIRQRLSVRAPDDGYMIHHCPNVPRVRSKPSEQIVFIEHEAIELPDQEIGELLEYEGLDFEDAVFSDETWSESKHHTVCIDLRFCNIVDGYVPLVRAIHDILPPLADGDIIEVSWLDDSKSWFPCTVSRTKRAVYNLQGKLKNYFEPLPSGVKLYITRVGTRRYRFFLNRRPHIVRNCKFFVSDGEGGWKVEFCDKTIEWETGDEIFRHQLTFQQMEALYNEARISNRSVRDAVYETMRRFAQSERVHVRTVYDAVFLWLRTCSLASVWAQFRPEHKCYVRVAPGWYRFDPTRPLPMVRAVTLPNEAVPPRAYSSPYSKDVGRYRIKSRGWRLNIYRNRLEEYRHVPDAYLEVRCGFGTLDEKVFIVPMPHLLERVIPNVDCNELGRYLFTVSQHDLVFTWDHGFRMAGKPFLERPGRVDCNTLFV